jgi:hypothetical protein
MLLSIFFATEYTGRGSSIGIATGYRLDTERSKFSPGKVMNVHVSVSSIPALGSTQPPIQWVRRTFPTSAVVKKLVKHKDNFSFFI